MYKPDFGWIVLEKPSTYEFKGLLETGLKGLRIAHKWDEEWDTGIWKATRRKGTKTWHEVRYPSDGNVYRHELPLDGYGMDKFWCLIKREE